MECGMTKKTQMIFPRIKRCGWLRHLPFLQFSCSNFAVQLTQRQWFCRKRYTPAKLLSFVGFDLKSPTSCLAATPFRLVSSCPVAFVFFSQKILDNLSVSRPSLTLPLALSLFRSSSSQSSSLSLLVHLSTVTSLFFCSQIF